MNPKLIMGINSLIPWLQTSLGVAAAVEQRSKFEGAFKIALIERLQMLGVKAMPEKNRVDVSWSTSSGDVLIELKTINTNFTYSPCIKVTRPITQNISDILSDIHKLKRLHFSEAYTIFVVFPCSINDSSWEYHLNKIKKEVFSIQESAFYFANNTPGLLYIAEVEKRNEDEKLLLNAQMGLISLESNNYSESNAVSQIMEKSSNIKSKRGRASIMRGTYLKILTQISNEMRLENKVVTVRELQADFENKFYDELMQQNPNSNDEALNSSLTAFRNGAKAAQITLNTINDKNRIHFRSPLNVFSDFNNFILLNTDRKRYLDQKITAFDPTNLSFSEYVIYFSNEKGSLDSVLIKDLK